MNTCPAATNYRWIGPAILIAVLVILFWRSFLPDYVHFSNDGPLGQQNVAWSQLPGAFTGMWDDLNDIGHNGGFISPNITAAIKWLLGPIGYSKFYQPLALFILGMGAWTFFCSLKLSVPATVLGTLAVTLNSAYFAGACWGIASVEIALGMNFLAIALISANSETTSWLIRWIRIVLAGLCVGMNVMEGADIGALCSVLVALFVFYNALLEPNDVLPAKIVHGLGRVAVIAVFAGLLATQTVVSLVGTSVQGIAGTAQDAKTKAEQWDWATQWSLPKKETLGLFVPGLFGYKMDTPKDMMPILQDSYQGGVYWGGMGRSPEIDRFLDSGGQGQMPPGFMRFSGGGAYCGLLVCLVGVWTIIQATRKKNTPFSHTQRRLIWFWTAVMVISLLLSWGRFAPIFYGALYHLPYFSTIRNPAKFLIFFSWAIVVLSAYGVHALSERQLKAATSKGTGIIATLTNWWAQADKWDRNWTKICVGFFVASIVGWLVFLGEKGSFVAYLQKMGFPDEALANQIAAFCLNQIGWFLILLGVALVLISLFIASYFSGPRLKMGAALLGAFLIFDLVRADVPYIVHWDYKQKYEVGSLNPIVASLRDQPYEHRVSGLPFHAPEGLELLDQLYKIEWMQHLFPYYNIQCLDIIQMPRMPEDLKNYLEALSPRGTAESVPLIAREWELTNTRYILGPAGFLDVLNQQVDPEGHRFRIVQQFEIVPKPGITHPTQLEELTAVPNQNGRYALFEFSGALPRAKLYSNWRVNTNDLEVLKILADLKFDPYQTVLVDTPEENLPTTATNENNGTVEFKSYAPKLIVLATDAKSPSVLLLNDKCDPNWTVTVDGQPAELLRCNYIMRGVYLPVGQHTVKFKFELPNKPLYVTLSAAGLGVLLLLILLWHQVTGRTQQAPVSLS